MALRLPAAGSETGADVGQARGEGGATYGTRTRDIQDHNLALYQLS